MIAHRRAASRVAGPLLLVLVLAACGSTVQTAAGGPVAVQGGELSVEAGGDGLQPGVPGAPGAAGQDGLGGGAAGTGAGGSVAPDGSGGFASSGNSTSGGSGQPGGPAPGAAVPAGAAPAGSAPDGPAVGITKDTIFLGAGYSNDTAAGNAALGAAGAAPGDDRDYYNAVIAEVNARGGVLGRKLKGVYGELRASSTQSVDQQYQALCDFWFKDNKVFSVNANNEVVYECSAKAGAVVLGGGGTAPVYARNPHLVAPTSIRIERLSAVTVEAMVKLKWHVPDATWPTGKIGVITWDSDDYKYAYKQGLEKALVRNGLQADQVVYVQVSQSANGLSDSSAAINNAVLSFQARGIDHVFIQDGPAGLFKGAGLTLLFLQSAENQGYRPRYGFNANNAPGNSALPARQQRGMLAITNSNFQPSSDEGIAPNPARERCHAVMKKARVDVSSDATQVQAAQACDYVWFMEQTLRRAGAPTRSAFLQAVDRTGTSFAASFVYGTRLHSGRRDGAELFRTSRFDDGCSCMRYTSQPFAP